MSSKTTSHLLSLDPAGFRAATEHPWLRLVGQGNLPKDAQLAWLKQDRLYATSYVSFIGGLLAKVKVPTTANRTSTLEWRIADTLIEALVGIKRELAMFEDILRESFNWPATEAEVTEPAEPTKLYQALFADAASPQCPLLVGLTALWATEKCYFEAWKFAGRQEYKPVAQSDAKDTFHETLIPNWTNPEFEGFVEAIADLVNDSVTGSEAAREHLPEMERMWQRVLEVEIQFWPDVKGE